MLRCGNWDNATGKFIQFNIEALKLEMGMPDNWSTVNYELFEEGITPTWTKTVWKYCWENELMLTDPTPDVPLRRENDKFLMKAFATGLVHLPPTHHAQSMQMFPEDCHSGRHLHCTRKGHPGPCTGWSEILVS